MSWPLCFLKKVKAGDIKVLGGGVIPAEDIPLLKKSGIADVFTPGTPLQVIVDAFKDACESFFNKKGK